MNEMHFKMDKVKKIDGLKVSQSVTISREEYEELLKYKKMALELNKEG